MAAMERILEQLSMGTLIENFREQRVDPSVVLSSSDTELIRLGVNTIGDRVRLRERCKEAEESDARGQLQVTATNRAERSNMASQIQNERSLLFAPGSSSRSRRQTSRSTSSRSRSAKQIKRPWTVNFVCLADRLSFKIPNANEKQILHSAGLGSKKIKLDMNDDEQMVLDKLVSDELKDEQTIGFPQLRNCGGFELMVCTSNCRKLSRIDSAWDAASLKAILGGGQSKIYLRPIQTSISTKTASNQRNKSTLKEKCKMCNQEMLLSDLRIHFMLCNKDILDAENEDNDFDEPTTAMDTETSLSSVIVDVVSPQSQSSSSERVQDGTSVMVSESVDDIVVVEITDETDGHNPRDEPNIMVNQVNTFSDITGIDEKVAAVAAQCEENGISDNAVEILRFLQAALVIGRDLEISSPDQCPEGVTNFIMVDRQNLIPTAFEEIPCLENKHVTLEIQFYNESALDYGGPRREFFMLVLREIKEKYFDLGLNETKLNDYYVIGLIIGLSILQNGKIPQFFENDVIRQIFSNAPASPCLMEIRKGFQDLGIYQICQRLPIFMDLFRRGYQTLTFKRFTTLFQPTFSEEGSNKRRFEGEIYSLLLQYVREAASGRRGNITLEHILGFTTGTDEEPVLGFVLQPSIRFMETTSFLPTANTCISCLKIPRASFQRPLPSKEVLFNLYDHAFANSYFGLV